MGGDDAGILDLVERLGVRAIKGISSYSSLLVMLLLLLSSKRRGIKVVWEVHSNRLRITKLLLLFPTIGGVKGDVHKDGSSAVIKLDWRVELVRSRAWLWNGWSGVEWSGVEWSGIERRRGVIRGLLRTGADQRRSGGYNCILVEQG